MARKRKKDNVNISDLAFPLDSEMDHILRHMIQDMLSSAELADEGSPLVYGFNIKVDKNGVPMIEQFGNVKNAPNGMHVTEKRKPMVDVIDREGEIAVIAEVPGVDKRGISVKATSKTLEISSKGEDASRNYFNAINLPESVNTKGARARYKNGILEVTLKKGTGKEAEKTITVD